MLGAAPSQAEAQGALGIRPAGEGDVSQLASAPPVAGAWGGRVGAALSGLFTGSASVFTRYSFGRGTFARLSCERRNANDSFERRPIGDSIGRF